MLKRFSGWCFDHRRLVVVAWLGLVIVASVLGKAEGGTLTKTFSAPHTDSSRAATLLGRDLRRRGDTGDVVWAVRGVGQLHDPAVEASITTLVGQLRSEPHVVGITSPYDAGGASGLLSQDGRIGHATIQFDVAAENVPAGVASDMRALASRASTSSLEVDLGGSMFVTKSQPKSEAVGLAGAVIILLLAFGSVLAMGLPIVTALTGIGIGLAAVELLARIIHIPNFAGELTALVGLGVGIDYALFIVTRHREQLHGGATPRHAAITAINTSGRAVLFAGCTVVVSLIGLVVVGLDVITGAALGAAFGVLLVMLASISLLPALLGFAGPSIDRFALPGARRSRTSSVWVRWANTIQRHPVRAVVGSLAVLGVLAVPVFSLRLGSSDNGNLPHAQTARRAYDLLARGFGPGSNGPLFVVAQLPPDVSAAGVAAGISALGTTPGVARVGPAAFSADRRSLVVPVIPAGAPQDASTTQLLHRLRSTLHDRLAGTGVITHVGGQTAGYADLATVIGHRLVWFFLIVLGLSFVLLTLVFRSILVPLKAVIMNLLSIGAAYGVTVAIFQWGWLGSVVGIGKAGPIESWVPLMLFAIVFGLSMDYEVFMLSRIREEYDLSGDNRHAVAHGLAVAARLITAAAAIMIFVFGSFITSDLRPLKLIGLGLAVAVLIDATIVRLVLVPATMELLGDRNWWFPKALRWLPRLHIDGADADGDLAEQAPDQPVLVPPRTAA